MVESAAVQDISDASVYSGALNAINTFLIFFRICYPLTVHQNRILRLVCNPHMVCFYAVSPISVTYEPANVSRPCPLSGGPSQPCSSPASDEDGQQLKLLEFLPIRNKINLARPSVILIFIMPKHLGLNGCSPRKYVYVGERKGCHTAQRTVTTATAQSRS